MIDTATETYTEAEATDEMVLLLTRKLRRLHPEAFADIWNRIPEGAQRAVYDAERRADRVRDAHGIGTKSTKTWAPVEDFDEE